MIVASAKAAECRVYWINAMGERGQPNGEARPVSREDYRDRLRALASGLFANPVLTTAPKFAMVPRQYVNPAQVVPLKRRNDNAR